MSNSPRWKQFVVAAVASALASVFIVAVGPGFSEPNDNAADQAVEATSEATTTTEAEVTTTEEEDSTYTPDPDTTPGGGDDIEANASTKEDSHGHVGSGTGTSTGSQADPGHNENTEDVNDDRYQSNGPGTGDDDADECLNEESSVNGDTDPGTGGANESGPYDSTCDGRISQNGQGDGANGAGTPCAGCVGNADDKNPPGQVKEFEGKKANDMGYECDGNQGVGAHYGNGNPAHTGDCGGTEEEPPPPCPTDMNPYEDGIQCVAPTPILVCRQIDGEWQIVSTFEKQPGDKNAPDSGLAADCVKNQGGGGPNPIYVCRPDGNGGWTIAGPIQPNEKQPGDKEVAAGTNPSECAKPDNVQGKVTICHATGSATNPYVIITVSVNALEQGHDETHGDLNPVNPAQCVPSVNPQVDCTGDTDATNNHTCNPPPPCPVGSPLAGQMPPGGNYANCYFTPPAVCPAGSTMAGQPVPGNNVNNCYVTPPAVCPAGSDMAGQPVPGGNVPNCYITPPAVCPAGSTMAGQPLPGGNVNNCYGDDVLPTKYCPAGSDMAGLPVPPGGVKNCNDDVLGGAIGGDKDGGNNPPDTVGAGGASKDRKPLGGVLPFTGTSILAYVLVALQMIGAGALIVRGRKARK